jgi:predicted ATP-grasp superfamily ATP-dependent carboligase
MRSSPLKILVHEYVTGGGWQGTELPARLAAEALAMLMAVLKDFQSWGRAHITTTLDSRFDDVPLLADRVVRVHHEGHISVLSDLLSHVDAALIIAPESDGILMELSALVENMSAQLLGSSSKAVAIAGDKWDCFHRLAEAGLPTPNTWRASCTDAIAVAGKVGFPLVVKPIDGVGCEGVGLASDFSSLNLALELMGSRHKDILLQQYVPGTHASVSLLVSGPAMLPLSLNEQKVSIGIPFFYQGGVVPLQHSRWRQALENARRAASLVPGLKGYIGIDMVLADEECYVIEINPRLTTSYVGLRQVINFNLAEAIWNACCKDTLPQQTILSGTAAFGKEEFGAVRHA